MEGDGFPPLADLAALRMGVRVDQEGVRKVDYHTAGGGSWNGKSYGVVKADGTLGDTVLSHRYYLSGAIFLVGLEGDPILLRRLRAAIERPVWQLFLGRKSFVPDGPVFLPEGGFWRAGQWAEPLENSLVALPSLKALTVTPPSAPEERRTRLILETSEPDAEVRMDQPLSFEPRRFGVRYVRTKWILMKEAS
jgi:CRISPR system Cascade subunit CasD